MNKAIKIEGLSKAYQLGQFSTGTLSQDLHRWWAAMRGKEDPFLKIGESNDRTSKGKSNVVWSLKDVNIEVEQGDTVGVIGRNGAGKSTLLKILSQVTSPTKGKVKIRGRIASLLEVGTGFHPELSGRENIFLNGAILGMRKEEIRRKFDEIVDFAGVERYIDTPVKRYSSGMYVRLAFAVAAHLESEILIVDEVLAVGDAEFQNKCLGKMNQVSKGEGRTVLFVSHNLSSIRTLCTKGIFLEQGSIKLASSIGNVLNLYSNSFTTKNQWSGVDGSPEISIYQTYIRPVAPRINGREWYTDDDLEIGIELSINEEINEVGIGFILVSSDSTPLARVFFNDFNNISKLKKGKYLVRFILPAFHLAKGSYQINFDVSLPNICKVNSENLDLTFSLLSRDSRGNRYNSEPHPTFTSLVRPNWFKEIISI